MLAAICTQVFITGNGKGFGVGKFACVEIKSFGEIFQEAIYLLQKLLRCWICACGKEIESP